MSLELAIFRARACKSLQVGKSLQAGKSLQVGKSLQAVQQSPKPALEFRPPVQIIPMHYAVHTSNHITVDMIRRQVCAEYDVLVSDIMSDRRNAGTVLPRQVTQYLCTRLTKLSVSELGRRLNRNHATVMHGRDKIAYLRTINQALDLQIAMLEAKLEAMVTS